MFCKLKQVLKLILPLKIQKYIKKKILFLNLLRYNLEIKKRAKYDIFEYRKLSADMNLYTKEYGYNSFYGLADIVKKNIRYITERNLEWCYRTRYSYWKWFDRSRHKT